LDGISKTQLIGNWRAIKPQALKVLQNMPKNGLNNFRRLICCSLALWQLVHLSHEHVLATIHIKKKEEKRRKDKTTHIFLLRLLEEILKKKVRDLLGKYKIYIHIYEKYSTYF
jgi:hypothetical protein